MKNIIKIEPISRLEGKARITFEFNEMNKEITRAEFNVLEFRAFEKFMEARMARELPRITPRICGICPVSHHLASAKATDMLARTIIPIRAKLHRELMHMAQMVHSHVLHIYFLALPDFVDGFNAESNDFRLLLDKNPQLVKDVIKIRAFAQKVIEIVGGKAIHPVAAIPGGISKPISAANKTTILSEAKELLPLLKTVLEAAWEMLDAVPEDLKQYETLATHNLSMIGPGKTISLYDGEMLITDPDGKRIAGFRGGGYQKYIEERTSSYSWTKFPYLKDEEDYERSILQVGPLARQKVYDTIPTELAGDMLQRFRNQFGRYTQENFATHYARIMETLYAFERLIEILEDKALLQDTPYRVQNTIKQGVGVGIIEAPRGTVIHNYESNDEGRITNTDIIVATTFNNPAINLALFKVAKKNLKQDGKIDQKTLRYVESSVRVFDPCLTCSSHAINNFDISVQSIDGRILQSIKEQSTNLY
ncbi:MAG: Ni/Fe hydrogenase subunit alpha [Candidatus Heimdallarchaeota archaeon]|nr:Ni/Fe hydrogenase subunit alpha [Candidatus Heimdallarchaeota archaeon]